MFRYLRTSVLVVLGLVLLASCATQQAAREGRSAASDKNWDAAVYYYLEALAKEPDNMEYRMNLVRARQKAAEEHFQRGESLKDFGKLVAAKNELQMAVQLDPTHQYAQQELDQVEKDLKVLAQPEGAKTLEQMKKEAREAKVKPPILNPKSNEPITLSFPSPKPVKEIYQALGKAYGFNVLFDPKLKDDKISVELTDVTAEQALEIVMQAAGHFYKVLDPHSIIIADDTPQNRRDYEDLVIKTFFLSNADVKDVDKLLRALIEARRLATNEQLNAITLRDTADKVAIAERLVNINDKAKAEVMIDVELMQVNSSKETNIGALLDAYKLPVTLDTSKVSSTGGDKIYLNELSNISNGDWSVAIPNFVINLVKNTTDAETLAQPQLRVTEGEKASLVIGDRLPIPVTSFNTQYAGGTGGVVPITSYQYQDVGIKIEVEPRVHHNREITLKLTVEVSQVIDSVTTNAGSQPIIGTRTITSVIRLRDGETNLLAGLFRRDTSERKDKVPLLGDIPLLGRLFTNKTTSNKTTDLVLTLTPHIIRFPDIHEEDLAPVWVGTESRISYFGSSPRVQSGRQPTGPFDRAGEDQTETGEGSDQAQQRRFPVPGRSSFQGGEQPSIPVPQQRPEQGHPPSGVNLVPSSGDSQSLSSESTEGSETAPPDSSELAPQAATSLSGTELAVPEAAPTSGTELVPSADARGVLDRTPQPRTVGLDPSVSSLKPGTSEDLRVVISGGAGSLHLPVTLSYDPTRLRVDRVVPAPGVLVVDQQEGSGWIKLDLLAAEGPGARQPLVDLSVTGIQAGPVPLVFTSDGARTMDGTVVSVSCADAGLFVLDGPAQPAAGVAAEGGPDGSP